MLEHFIIYYRIFYIIFEIIINMASKIKKVIKCFIIFGIIIVLLIVLGVVSFFIFTPTKFSLEKITDSNLSLQMYDQDKRPISHTFLKGDFIELKLIPKHTIDCFISIEDKEFYSHNGINIKRILGATLNNIKSFSLKEGASTISQQLIKNTHLSSEKTFTRKLNEVKLTLALEKQLSKDKILEYYLNIIYFGDNCYGIQNASEKYFSKSATKLTTTESAMLAGMIKSPNKFHPYRQYDNCIKRRNVVLKELLNDKKISTKEYQEFVNEKTEVKYNDDINKQNCYIEQVINEAKQILNMPEKQIAIGEYKIYSYLNLNKQRALEDSINKNLNEDCCMISMNTSGNVEAYTEKSSIPMYNIKRQPASAIKPVLVYAPAINENIISPQTMILDENISINGYTPKNIGNKEYGYVSAKTALSKSLNIPAVKVMSYVGIDKCKNYLSRQNVEFDSSDNSLALALGGMTHGVTLSELCNCYQTLANNGKYVQHGFIDYIVNNAGKVVYRRNTLSKEIYRTDTSYLVTNMLLETSKTGTAKRLSNLPYNIASKTGTSSLSSNNIDAYNISYTTEDIVGCWIGNLNRTKTEIVGAGEPTIFVKNYLSKIYEKKHPKNFIIPSSVVELEIDTLALENEHVVYKASNFLPERYRKKETFSRFNIPKTNEIDTLTINPIKIDGYVLNNQGYIGFNANMLYTYELYLVENESEKLLETISFKKGKTEFIVDLKPKTLYNFIVKVKAKDYINNKEYYSQNSNIISLFFNDIK